MELSQKPLTLTKTKNSKQSCPHKTIMSTAFRHKKEVFLLREKFLLCFPFPIPYQRWNKLVMELWEMARKVNGGKIETMRDSEDGEWRWAMLSLIGSWSCCARDNSVRLVLYCSIPLALILGWWFHWALDGFTCKHAAI